MLERGDIVVERLTGKRAIVINVAGEEIRCRFGDGRIDDRFDFELEPMMPILQSLIAFLGTLLWTPPRERPQMQAGERVRMLSSVRPNAS